ncbi:hypothetical protein DHEL01_v201039 [Diaporthe helianthi]|uniref:Ubiquitin-like protein smt3 n=1 Tax=Diaporthe helianthi TaxID=158607 RepID=A0A2P5IDK2_DIAHE|nr:hypothetical protein DHEL01_v201039 [Diaporthe helianthi]
MSSQDSKDVISSVSKLSLDTQKAKQPAKPKAKKDQVADSWEDEDVSSDTETETERTNNPAASEGDPHGTSAPPPTPVTPSYSQGTFVSTDPTGGYHISTGPSGGAPAARPEKTDAVARRLIAGALGMRAPKLSEEQKNYDKAVREKERKRREEEKAAQRRREEEAAKAKAAMWDS